MNLNSHQATAVSDAPSKLNTQPDRVQVESSNSAEPVDLEMRSREVALEAFIVNVQKRFKARFKGMSYDSPQWDFREPSGQTDKQGRRLTLQEIYRTKVVVARPKLVEDALSSLHPSFARAARAILAVRVIQNKSKDTGRLEMALRLCVHLEATGAGEKAGSERALHLDGLTVHEFTVQHLLHIERSVLTASLTPDIATALKREKFESDHLIVQGVEMRGLAADSGRRYLLALCDSISVLQGAKAINPIYASLDHEVADVLQAIEQQQARAFRNQKAVELEPGIAALSDAISAMADGDPRLSMIQQAVLCVMGLEMCAPSRINEVMTMSIHDRLRAVEAYELEPVGSSRDDKESLSVTEAKLLHRAHAGIKEASTPSALDELPNTVLMKGSKGAAWGAKPILDFMLVMFNECFDRLVQMGSRSRMLLEHYEKSPTTLYLPPELENLRGRPLSAIQIGRIMLLDGDFGSSVPEFKAKALMATKASQFVVRALREKDLMFALDQRPELASQVADERADFIHRHFGDSASASDGSLSSSGERERALSKTDIRTEYAAWSSVEAELLGRVNAAMDSIRWVTGNTAYQGRLANMLVLFDHLGHTAPYLPGAISASDVAKRLKSRSVGRSGSRPIQTVFEALDLTMPIVTEGGGKVEVIPAHCRSHDPRRWLNTMALRHAGPQLSRLLINLWANRVDAGQLSGYDYSTPEQKAERTALEVPHAMRAHLNEHADLSKALTDELLGDYGLKTNAVSVGSHAIRLTTMDAIHEAERNHPVAKAGSKLILIFPTAYGACLHQHYEVGCTNYRGCGGACSDQRVVKGHMPTNEQVRKRSKELDDVIVAQVRRLILARNRGVVHDLEKLDEHLTRMIKQHIGAEEIARRLIAEFHQIKDLIKDAAFKSDLEDAFAFKGMVEKLDDPQCPSGALIRYHNPERHGRPEAERSLEALGGRQAIEAEVKTFLEERDWIRLETRAANDADDDADVEDDGAREFGNGISDELSD